MVVVVVVDRARDARKGRRTCQRRRLQGRAEDTRIEDYFRVNNTKSS